MPLAWPIRSCVSNAQSHIFGIGPVLAAMLIGHTGDIGRFRTRDHYVAYNRTAPAEFSSGGRIVHRVSTRGNRQLNHAIHMVGFARCATPAPRAGSTSTAKPPRARRSEKRSAL